MKRYYTDRSRTETAQRCKRQRYWEYHCQGLGIVPTRKSLALIVGGCVHDGLARLLWDSQQNLYADAAKDAILCNSAIEQLAVSEALHSYDQFLLSGKLELDAMEQQGLATAVTAEAAGESTVNFAAELGLDQDDPLVAKFARPNTSGQDQEKWLESEQRALIEAMVRAYARRRLRPLLEEFEVLEVETEGEWLLSEEVGTANSYQLWWMSRPDALLRHRVTNELHVMSFKTTGQWDVRKEKDASHDMQGLSEGVEIERRLTEWWTIAQDCKANGSACSYQVAKPIWDYLLNLQTAPRISAIRYEYLLKGERDKKSRMAKQLSERIGIECRVQQSPLILSWVKQGMTSADVQLAHSFSWTGDDGKDHKLYYKDWNQQAVFVPGSGVTVKDWIDALDQGVIQPEANRDVLAEQFVAPMTIYRNEDDLRDWVEQTEAAEVANVQNADKVNAADSEDEKRHLLNVLFPQTRRACEYPGTCSFVALCYGTAELRADPVGSGKYKVREPNHPQELKVIQ